MNSILLRGRLGLGDNVYQRAAVRELVDKYRVYLETPWPQLYADLPIQCVKRPTTLRTQSKNASRVDLVWYAPPTGLMPRVVGYAGSKGTMLQGLFDSLLINPPSVTFDLPAFDIPVFARPASSRAYVVIRPATVRKEWPAEARNPLPEYIALAASKLRAHFDIVSVADLSPGAEWALPPLPYADESYHAGELGVEDLMGLVAGAAGVVAGVGWAIPAAVAYRVPLFVIYGGSGVHDGPQRIFDHRMPTELVHHAIPDRFCLCANRSHSCDKRIGNIERQLDEWIVGLVAREQAAVVPAAGPRVSAAG